LRLSIQGSLELSEWNELIDKVVKLQSIIHPFRVGFLDRESFKRFCDGLPHNLTDYEEICITGYFSETVRKAIETLAKWKKHVRLICPEFPVKSQRDRRNIQALRKLTKNDVEVKFNHRLHARLLVAYNTYTNSKTRGFLILGSFDFNTDCIGLERHDAGIETRHPDLVKSAVDFFNKLWGDSESITIEEFLESEK
jgi:hypothetical protein